MPYLLDITILYILSGVALVVIFGKYSKKNEKN